MKYIAIFDLPEGYKMGCACGKMINPEGKEIYIEEKIEEEINDAIERGQFECVVCPFTQMSPEVKNRIKEDLTKLGYKVEIEDNDIKYKNAPCDQRPWYDDITINWNKDGE